MKNSSNYRLTLLPILVIMAFSTFTPTLAYAAPLANSDKDWQYMNGNSWAWNYSPQDQINKNNVDQLEVKWIFPIGGRSNAPAGLQSLNMAEGSSTPPIVRNGVVLISTNFLKLYAIDAKTGKQKWTYDYNINITDIKKRLPWQTVGIQHQHGFRYWESGDAVLFGGLACDLVGVDFKTGKPGFWIQDLCKDIPGNVYNYRPTPNDVGNVATYEKGKQFIFGISGNLGSWNKVGRSVYMGIDMDSKKVIWRIFNQPPQDVATKDWALQECDIGILRDLPCSEVASKNRAGLEWDWAQPDQPPNPYGGVSATWGQPVVDEDTGRLYIQTGNQSPYSNLSLTPGPRLYGSTIMSIDLNAGKRVWWVQPFPHDPYDYDCNWSGVLADVPNVGKVYMKGCKEGRLYAIDAATGKPRYIVDALEEQYPGKKHYHLTDPLSLYDLREWGWPDNGKYDGPNTVFIPSWHNGFFETDMTHDGKGVVYHYAAMMPRLLVKSLPLSEGGSGMISSDLLPTNTTIVARDIATGKVKWTWFYQYSAQRAHMVATSDLLFTGFTDGNMRFFDREKGQLLRTLSVGSPVVIGPTIAKDSDGNSKIFTIVGFTGAAIGAPRGVFGPASPNVPGTLVAIGLSDKATITTAAQTTTVTTTQSTTLTTTSATTITSTSATTVATTITTTAPGQTVTTSAAETIGPITYAAVAIAVIAIIGAAILAMRKK